MAKLQITPKAYSAGQSEHVAARQNDRQQLQADDQVDDAVAGAEAVMRLLEPGGQHAVFGHAVQHAVGADDRRILRARQNQHADQHDKAVEEQLGPFGPTRYIGDAADQVPEVIRPHACRE